MIRVPTTPPSSPLYGSSSQESPGTWDTVSKECVSWMSSMLGQILIPAVVMEVRSSKAPSLPATAVPCKIPCAIDKPLSLHLGLCIAHCSDGGRLRSVSSNVGDCRFSFVVRCDGGV